MFIIAYMNRLKVLGSSLALIAFALPFFSFADTTYNGAFDLQSQASLNGGTFTLTKSGSPYYFPDALQIDQNVTINVDPGVVINMGTRSMFLQNGTINFNGTKDEPIKINGTYQLTSIRVEAATSGQTPTANFKNVIFNGAGYCIVAYQHSIVNVEDSEFNDCANYGIYSGFDSHITIKNIKSTNTIFNSNYRLVDILLSNFTVPGEFYSLDISGTEFPQDEMHKIGIERNGSNLDPSRLLVKINNNSFIGDVANKEPIDMSFSTTVPIDATGNYWGTGLGPYHVGDTPTNGPKLATNIIFEPFLATDPNALKECCSSVLFIPGIEGSRLYNKRENGTEDQLWEPNIPSDIEELYGDAQGNTDPGIYTRDIIERTNITGRSPLDENVYVKISENLLNLRNTDKIKDFKTIPYDWRENVDDILQNGIKIEDKTVMLIPELENMAANSDTGKVTIITHSNGGLLAKALIKELEAQAKANLIDKVVIVAAPQLGTPDAIYALLHGVDFPKGFGLLAPQNYNRELAQNIEMAYSLLPSRSFYDSTTQPIYFDSSLGDYGNLIASYGNSIDSYDELKSFILGSTDGRGEADFNNTNQIGLGNEYLYNKAEPIHDELDNYNFPNNIKLYQVSGTGGYTNEKLIYIKSRIIFGNILIPYLQKNIYGDGTVLNKSSNIMPGNNYYFDLYNFNKDTGKDLSHAYLMEAQPLVDFINKIIKDESVITSYVTQAVPDYSTLPTTIVTMHSPVDIHLYDSAGRHTGPLYINGQKFVEENIPNSHYEQIGDAVSIIITGNEQYNLKLDGYDNGLFTLDIDKFMENTKTSSISFIDLKSNPNLSSEITIAPDTINKQILLDNNSDGILDLQANSDGTIVDLTKHDCSGKIKDKKGDKAMNCKNL